MEPERPNCPSERAWRLFLAAAKGAPRSGSTLSRTAFEPLYRKAVSAVFSCCGAERRLLGRGTRLWSLGSAWPLRASPHDDALALPTKRPRRGTLPSRYPLVGAVSVCAPLSRGHCLGRSHLIPLPASVQPENRFPYKDLAMPGQSDLRRGVGSSCNALARLRSIRRRAGRVARLMAAFQRGIAQLAHRGSLLLAPCRLHRESYVADY